MLSPDLSPTQRAEFLERLSKIFVEYSFVYVDDTLFSADRTETNLHVSSVELVGFPAGAFGIPHSIPLETDDGEGVFADEYQFRMPGHGISRKAEESITFTDPSAECRFTTYRDQKAVMGTIAFWEKSPNIRLSLKPVMTFCFEDDDLTEKTVHLLVRLHKGILFRGKLIESLTRLLNFLVSIPRTIFRFFVNLLRPKPAPSSEKRRDLIIQFSDSALLFLGPDLAVEYRSRLIRHLNQMLVQNALDDDGQFSLKAGVPLTDPTFKDDEFGDLRRTRDQLTTASDGQIKIMIMIHRYAGSGNGLSRTAVTNLFFVEYGVFVHELSHVFGCQHYNQTDGRPHIENTKPYWGTLMANYSNVKRISLWGRSDFYVGTEPIHSDSGSAATKVKEWLTGSKP